MLEESTRDTLGKAAGTFSVSYAQPLGTTGVQTAGATSGPAVPPCHASEMSCSTRNMGRRGSQTGLLCWEIWDLDSLSSEDEELMSSCTHPFDPHRVPLSPGLLLLEAGELPAVVDGDEEFPDEQGSQADEQDGTRHREQHHQDVWPLRALWWDRRAWFCGLQGLFWSLECLILHHFRTSNFEHSHCSPHTLLCWGGDGLLVDLGFLSEPLCLKALQSHCPFPRLKAASKDAGSFAACKECHIPNHGCNPSVTPEWPTGAGSVSRK